MAAAEERRTDRVLRNEVLSHMTSAERKRFVMHGAVYGIVLALALTGPGLLIAIASGYSALWVLTGTGACLMPVVIVFSNVYGKRFVSRVLARTQWAVDQGIRPEDIG